MDLKIKDVAELLNVSEKTIRRWLMDGKIPAYRLHSQYRFSRIESENWVMSCKLHQDQASPLKFSGSPLCSSPQIAFEQEEAEEEAEPKVGLQQFSRYRAIHKGGILCAVPGTTKEEIISTTVKQSAKILGCDIDILTELLLDREKLMPTALNHGVAVPHTREFVFKGPFDVVIVVFPEKPIEYGALDGNPIHTLFFLFASGDKHHLHLLAKIAHLSSNEKMLQLLKSSPDKQTLLAHVQDWEANL
jgi:PTS system nitrogen regulatory IIA component